MNKFSLTIVGILVMVGGTFLVELGFTESCSGEISSKIPLIIGGITAWIGRYKAGGISVGGFKK